MLLFFPSARPRTSEISLPGSIQQNQTSVVKTPQPVLMAFGPVSSEAERPLKLPEESVQTQQKLKFLWASLPCVQRRSNHIEVNQEQQNHRRQGNEMWSVHTVEEYGP